MRRKFAPIKASFSRWCMAIVVAIICAIIAYLIVDKAVELKPLLAFFIGVLGVLIGLGGVSLAIMIANPIAGIDIEEDDDVDEDDHFPDDDDDEPPIGPDCGDPNHVCECNTKVKQPEFCEC